MLNLYSWYTIEGNLGVFEPSAMYPGTQLKERYIDETGQIWYCIHLNGIPFELYDGTPNSTLLAIVNQNGDDDKSQDFNITEATGNDGHEAYLVYTTVWARLSPWPKHRVASMTILRPRVAVPTIS